MEKLQVPENITLRWEIWPGVGKREAAAIAIVAAVAIAVAVVFCIISSLDIDVLIAMFAVIMAFAFACGFFSRLDNNQSIFEYFQRQARYKREQQRFYYVKREEAVCLVDQEET